MIHLTDRQILRTIPPATALQLAEKAFRAWGEKRVQMPPKVYLTLPKGDFRAMPAYIQTRDGGVVGVKWISVYPQNASRRLPAVIGTLLLNDASTGALKAILEANALTALRTGAAGALATRLLARADARRLLLVGAGVQSVHQLHSHALLRKWDSILVWAPDPRQSAAFVRSHQKSLGPGRASTLRPAASLEAAVRSSDVICTCTPSRTPLIPASWVAPGTHINAIGADAPGKQELDVALLKKATLIVDDWNQASHSGEINVGHSAGRIRRSDIHGDLGSVLVGRPAFAPKPGTITVFDSTGLAVQDMMMAEHAVKQHASRS